MVDSSLGAQLASEKRSRDELTSEVARLSAEKRSRDEEVIVIPRSLHLYSPSSCQDPSKKKTFTDSRRAFFDGGLVQVTRLEARLEASKMSR
jgi:hypothetical protein